MKNKFFSLVMLLLIMCCFVENAKSQCSNPYVGEDDTVCGLTFHLTVNNATTGHWEAYFLGSLANPIPNYNPSANAADNYVTIANFSGLIKEYEFVWVDNSAVGCKDTVKINFIKTPSAYAGVAHATCGLQYVTDADYSMPQSEIYTPSGLWTVLNSPPQTSVNIEDVNNNVTNINVTECGIYSFLWTEFNTEYPQCSDDVIVEVEFVEIPVIAMMDDFDVCGICAQIECSSGVYPGSWNGSEAVFDDFSDEQTQVCVGAYGSHTFTWWAISQAMNSSHNCYATEDVVVTFWPNPNSQVLTSVADSAVCGLTFTLLRSESHGSSTHGIWFCEMPDIVFGDINSNDSWVSVPDYGNYNFYWIESTGPTENLTMCSDTSEAIPVRFIEVPQADAGEDLLFCGLVGNLEANQGICQGIWNNHTSCSLMFLDTTNPNTQVTSSIITTGDPNYPYFDLVWTEDNSNGCVDSDSIKVVFARVPSSEVYIIPPKCFGEEFTIAAMEDTLANYIFDLPDGLIDSIVEPNPSGGEYELFVHWDNDELSHQVSLQTTNYWGCQSQLNNFELVEPTTPENLITVYADTCLTGVGQILFDPDDDCTILWYDEDAGPPLNTEVLSVNELPASEYTVLANYLTSNQAFYSYYILMYGSAYCTDTITIVVENQILFNLECPEDLYVTETEELVLFDGNPAGGYFYFQGNVISYFDPVLYGNGSHTVYYRYYDDITHCLGECSFTINVDLPFSVDIERDSELEIFPNPNDGSFIVNTGRSSDRFFYEIYNVDGILMKKGQHEDGCQLQTNLIPGVYFLYISNESEIQIRKLVIQ
jgi:hypothetical protein